MTEPVWLEAKALVLVHAESVALFGGAAGVRDAGLLESALARPRNLFAYGETDTCALAAAYAFGLVRNHPFVDGNKRAAFLACAVFLEINGLRMIAGEADVAETVLAHASGAVDEAAFADWVRGNVAAG